MWCPSVAFAVEFGGKRLAYSGDTAWTEALVDVARDADVFVCEAYFFDKKVKYHLDYATLRDNRARLDAKRLVLTHMSRDLLERLGEVDVECAEDGLVLTL